MIEFSRQVRLLNYTLKIFLFIRFSSPEANSHPTRTALVNILVCWWFKSLKKIMNGNRFKV